jgi:hypothetical protein
MHSTSRSLTLLISGVLSAAMGAFHFFLPRIFSWEAGLGHADPELRWALFSLNCFFSMLLLCAGVTAIASWWRPALGVSSSLTLAAFWCVNVAYQWLVPPPWPRVFVLTLLAFAVFAAVLSLCAVAASLRRPRQLADPPDAQPFTTLAKVGTPKR